jgi:hypothetical protein
MYSGLAQARPELCLLTTFYVPTRTPWSKYTSWLFTYDFVNLLEKCIRSPAASLANILMLPREENRFRLESTCRQYRFRVIALLHESSGLA